MDLIHCIYCSAASKGIGEADLKVILAQSRRNNAELGISGMLLLHEGSFFQVLEGEREVVERLYEKIGKDARHQRTTKIIQGPIEERAFASWSMGCPTLNPKAFADMPGLNDFFVQGHSFLHLGEGRAKTLLAAFKEGRWRSAIT